MNIQTLKARVRGLLLFFIIALLLSGITAFPLAWELSLLNRLVAGPESPVPAIWPDLAYWIAYVNAGLQETYQQYLFMVLPADYFTNCGGGTVTCPGVLLAMLCWGC